MKAECVVKLDRILVFKDGQRKPTETIIDISKPDLTKIYRVGYNRVALSQFIPNPMKCYTCQKFGHIKFNCRKDEV